MAKALSSRVGLTSCVQSTAWLSSTASGLGRIALSVCLSSAKFKLVGVGRGGHVLFDAKPLVPRQARL